MTTINPTQWTSYLLPLPHEIRIADSVRCKPGEVGIALREQAGPIERQGAAELEALFVDKGTSQAKWRGLYHRHWRGPGRQRGH